MFQGVDGIVLDNNHNFILHANEILNEIFHNLLLKKFKLPE
jgi:hypothetical protein